MDTNKYDTTISQVLVFKTDISSENEVERVAHILGLEKKILRWNVDREDIDNVLRIECDQLHPVSIISRLSDAGFKCEELPD